MTPLLRPPWIALLAATLFIRGASAQTLPTPRPIGPIVATSPGRFTNVREVVVLSDGRVVVHDAKQRMVVALSPTLSDPVTIVDSAAGRPNSYGRNLGFLTPFVGDSVLFYDQTAGGYQLYDARGGLARVMARPRAPAPDGFSKALGVLFYRSESGHPCSAPDPAPGDSAVKCPRFWTLSAADLTTRQIDTLARLESGTLNVNTRLNSSVYRSWEIMLFPVIDGFGVAPDGSLAILRAREMRLEWIGADRQRVTSPRIAYPWHRLTEAERTHIIDSIFALRRNAHQLALAKWVTDSAAVGGVGPVRVTQLPGGQTARTPIARPKPPTPPSPAEIPDYLPATSSESLRVDGGQPTPAPPVVDPDFRVWIPLKADVAKQPYLVVDRGGAVVERVDLPLGRTIVGFAQGFAYLLARLPDGMVIEKVRVR